MAILSNLSPMLGEKNTDLDTTIEFELNDTGTGIDISSLIVLVNGERAIDAGDFTSRFDGTASEITPDINDYSVIIDPTFNFSKDKQVVVDVQVQDMDGDFFNQKYAFYTAPESPFLIRTSPEDQDTITAPQVIFLEVTDSIDGIDQNTFDLSINGLSYVTNGTFDSDLANSLSSISVSGNTATLRLEVQEPLRNGLYIVSFSVEDTLGNILRDSFQFTVDLTEVVLPEVIPQTGFLGYFQGIKRVTDNGIGDSLHIEWNTPIKRLDRTELFLLVFQNPNRLEIFDGNASYIALSSIDGANLNGLETGVTQSYGVRALETHPGIFDLTGMAEVSPGLYQAPEPAEATATLTISGQVLTVNSTEGFPAAGLLIINNEVMRYISKTSTSFIIANNGRGLNETTPSIHIPGDSVELFLQCADDNTVIIMGTPTYQDGYQTDRTLEGEGFLVTDYSDNDQNFFQGFDFCGYHKAIPEEIFGGGPEYDDDCGSYQGGEFNGMRGFDLYDRLLNREEALLNMTGEPVILIKRNWSGQTCSCMNSRRVHPKINSCPTCYGTGWDPGYLQYLNLRRDDRKIMIKLNEAPEDLKLGEYERFQQEFEPSAWTLPIPAIRDRDMIIRFDETGDLEYIYEVLDVSREKIFLNKYGRQSFKLKRMDKTDIIYTFPFQLF